MSTQKEILYMELFGIQIISLLTRYSKLPMQLVYNLNKLHQIINLADYFDESLKQILSLTGLSPDYTIDFKVILPSLESSLLNEIEPIFDESNIFVQINY